MPPRAGNQALSDSYRGFQPMLMGKPRDKELHQHERLKRVAAMSD
jgi:hypothetical protein